MKIEKNKDLSNINTLRISSRGDLYTLNTIDDLVEFVKNESTYMVLGLGANQVLPPQIDIPVLKLEFTDDLEQLKKPQKIYTFSASMKLNKLTAHAIKFGLKGWEGFTGIPATLGGAVYMNAGTGLGEMKDIVRKVKYVSAAGEIKEHLVNKDSFSYRKNNFLDKGDIIVEVELVHQGIDENISTKIKDYLQYRNDTQPLRGFTCGCIFKNKKTETSICAAGKFIDILGLKGLSVGGIKVSSLHGNFFINDGNATKDDILGLISIINRQCLLHYGVEFEVEAII